MSDRDDFEERCRAAFETLKRWLETHHCAVRIHGPNPDGAAGDFNLLPPTGRAAMPTTRIRIFREQNFSSAATISAVRVVFRTKTAFKSTLNVLALFISSSPSPVRNDVVVSEEQQAC